MVSWVLGVNAFLAFVLAVGGVWKIASPKASNEALKKVLPESRLFFWIGMTRISRLVGAVELAVAAGILLPSVLQLTFQMLAVLVFLSFSVFVLIARQRGSACGCFGAASQRVSRLDQMRNILLLLCSVATAFYRAIVQGGHDYGFTEFLSWSAFAWFSSLTSLFFISLVVRREHHPSHVGSRFRHEEVSRSEAYLGGRRSFLRWAVLMAGGVIASGFRLPAALASTSTPQPSSTKKKDIGKMLDQEAKEELINAARDLASFPQLYELLNTHAIDLKTRFPVIRESIEARIKEIGGLLNWPISAAKGITNPTASESRSFETLLVLGALPYTALVFAREVGGFTGAYVITGQTAHGFREGRLTEIPISASHVSKLPFLEWVFDPSPTRTADYECETAASECGSSSMDCFSCGTCAISLGTCGPCCSFCEGSCVDIERSCNDAGYYCYDYFQGVPQSCADKWAEWEHCMKYCGCCSIPQC